MKKHITLILVLMTMCVVGIIGLQLFWNFQNYKRTVNTFDHDINEALRMAVDRETNHRQDEIVNSFKGWLADTSLITITADHNNRDSNTVFHTSDTHPKYADDKKRMFTFGLTDYRQKLDRINPRAKAFMINHFGERIVKRDLREGVIYHYTQMLGDSLEKVYANSKVNLSNLQRLFKEELLRKDIRAGFILNPSKKEGGFLTRAVNTNFRKPYKKDLVYAGFESPNAYFFKEMKWVIVSSLLLIAITLACFTYTAKTLFSQDKLARLKDDFINNMTHELNTPLASIKITAEALKSFNYQPEIRKEYLDIITYQADKLTGMTGQILNSGKLTAMGEQCDFYPGKIIQLAIYELKAQIGLVNAQITYNALPGKFTVSGYPDSLRGAIVNLVDNALKYNSGTPHITISLISQSGFAKISITDNGIGIPHEYHDRVFDKFFRVPQGNRHNVKGYGLGLSYVKEVINQHNGHICIRDNEPTGSVIIIKLPLANE